MLWKLVILDPKDWTPPPPRSFPSPLPQIKIFPESQTTPKTSSSSSSHRTHLNWRYRYNILIWSPTFTHPTSLISLFFVYHYASFSFLFQNSVFLSFFRPFLPTDSPSPPFPRPISVLTASLHLHTTLYNPIAAYTKRKPHSTQNLIKCQLIRVQQVVNNHHIDWQARHTRADTRNFKTISAIHRAGWNVCQQNYMWKRKYMYSFNRQRKLCQ